ncbi:MAG: hypothetical protein LAT81_16145 [Oceanicaulis sp.]|nr:hypothetical protein [Oceanicaulis sp.]
MQQIRNIQNPVLIGGGIHCTVEVRLGDGVGAEWERVPYVAVPNDVSRPGNLVWDAICAGQFEALDHEPNFDREMLPPNGSDCVTVEFALSLAQLWPAPDLPPEDPP